MEPDGVKHLPESEVLRNKVKDLIVAGELPSNVSPVKIMHKNANLFDSPHMFAELKTEVEQRLKNTFNRFMSSKYYTKYACEVTIKESLVELIEFF